MVTCPLVDPATVIVTEHVACKRGHVVEVKRTLPLGVWVQITVPVGEYPATVTRQVMTVDEPATADFGAQEVLVVVTLGFTVNVFVPEDG